ncbi:hypothetical protein N7517_007020 [Penicillium concentricum]|uniref:Uncharacterized protein n=1 Tax=Penicillium concentricum TaxID=293559 RepID=A0A9W9SCG1_9EURO|nr:uncharacterized protein N7517_007020 [Penicillium concentricum]KAJ5375014.1 hypothetical protein N7517_007020 [Penicillium concentricum]
MGFDTEKSTIPLMGLGFISPSLQQDSYQYKFKVDNMAGALPPTALKYGRRQIAGRTLQQWIERPASDPAVPACPIQPCTLRFKDVKKSKILEIDMDTDPYMPIQCENDFEELGMLGPTGGAWARIAIDQPDAPPDADYPSVHTWEGQIARGVLIVEEIKKAPGFFISEVCQAIYREHFPIKTLKYVYILDVCNRDTREFVMDDLYTDANGLEWPDEEIYDWLPGTSEYEALLGTTIGRTVAYLILGSCQRGTRRISRIRTYDAFESLQMLFVIEDTLAQVSGDSSSESSSRETRSSTRRKNIESKKHKLGSDEESDTGAKKVQKR